MTKKEYDKIEDHLKEVDKKIERMQREPIR